MTERTEAQRLADALMQPVVLDRHAMEASSELLRLESEVQGLQARVHTCGPTCRKAGCINRRLQAENAALRDALPDLSPVINWLENGCDPKNAAKELRLYAEVIRAALSGTAPARTGDAA